jgi:hypothetical protein
MKNRSAFRFVLIIDIVNLFADLTYEGARVKLLMDPYAKPKERKIGAQRPKITHLPKLIERRTRLERQAEKQAIAAERRAIKKAARRHLKEQLLAELEDAD